MVFYEIFFITVVKKSSLEAKKQFVKEHNSVIMDVEVKIGIDILIKNV
jgi:hypothetical protein